MERTAEQTSVEREIRIAASPETVWEFLVDPEKIRRWKAVDASFDAHPGAGYRLEVRPGSTALGEVVEVDPPHRLVLTWGWEQTGDTPNPVPPGSSTVEYALVPDGDGTLLRLTHRDLPNAEACERHAEGWDYFLPRLAAAVAG